MIPTSFNIFSSGHSKIISTKHAGWLGKDMAKKDGGKIRRDEKKTLVSYELWMFSQYPTAILHFCEPTVDIYIYIFPSTHYSFLMMWEQVKTESLWSVVSHV